MGNINMTIGAAVATPYIKVDYLASDDTTVVGTDYFFASHIARLRSTGTGWWFDRVAEDEYNKEIYFSQIVLLNGVAIGATTYAAVTALILAICVLEAAQVT